MGEKVWLYFSDNDQEGKMSIRARNHLFFFSFSEIIARPVSRTLQLRCHVWRRGRKPINEQITLMAEHVDIHFEASKKK